MAKLFVVGSHYQLITAINMATTILSKEICDIILTDHSLGFDEISEKLNEGEVFRNAYYIELNDFFNSVNKYKRFLIPIKHYGDYLLPANMNYDYDELIFSSSSKVMLFIFKKIHEVNNNAVWSKFEDGLVNYIEEDPLVGFTLKIRNFIYRKFHVDDFYSYKHFTYFYKPNLVIFEKNDVIGEMKQLSALNENFKMKSILKMLYPGVERVANIEQYKFIFFEESYFADYDFNGDYKFISKFAKVVGHENILVKLHPRNSKQNRFSEIGINTISSVGIPWEAILFFAKLKDTQLLTLYSTSVLNTKLLFNMENQVYFLFNCIGEEIPIRNKEKAENFLYSIVKNLDDESVVIPDNETDFYKKVGSIYE
ncbi:MAG: alpha-2,8-polysialyltransferase family protein [Lactobacillales bacterium]|nr:alpha-2,8-polysialyltransferase family protein [Lactobacillales bacterium]